MSSNCTRLVQRDTFDGLFVRLAHLDGIGEGYNRMNHALKEYVETGAAGVDCRASRPIGTVLKMPGPLGTKDFLVRKYDLDQIPVSKVRVSLPAKWEVRRVRN